MQKRNKKLELLKFKNVKVRNKQAREFTDKSELENLFLDCVDESKKDVIKSILEKHANFDSAV